MQDPMMTIRDGALEEKWARFEDFATNLLLFHDNTSSLVNSGFLLRNESTLSYL